MEEQTPYYIWVKDSVIEGEPQGDNAQFENIEYMVAYKDTYGDGWHGRASNVFLGRAAGHGLRPDRPDVTRTSKCADVMRCAS